MQGDAAHGRRRGSLARLLRRHGRRRRLVVCSRLRHLQSAAILAMSDWSGDTTTDTAWSSLAAG